MDPNVLFWIRGVLQTLVGILGLIGNVTAIIILKKPSMKSCINYILLGKNSKSSNVPISLENFQVRIKPDIFCRFSYIHEFFPFEHGIYNNKLTALDFQFYTANVYGGLWGVCRFSLQHLWKRVVRITEKPYTPQKERLCILWGNPVIFKDCGEIL